MGYGFAGFKRAGGTVWRALSGRHQPQQGREQDRGNEPGRHGRHPVIERDAIVVGWRQVTRGNRKYVRHLPGAGLSAPGDWGDCRELVHAGTIILVDATARKAVHWHR